jgi:hypothetical protein
VAKILAAAAAAAAASASASARIQGAPQSRLMLGSAQVMRQGREKKLAAAAAVSADATGAYNVKVHITVSAASEESRMDQWTVPRRRRRMLQGSGRGRTTTRSGHDRHNHVPFAVLVRSLHVVFPCPPPPPNIPSLLPSQEYSFPVAVSRIFLPRVRVRTTTTNTHKNVTSRTAVACCTCG